MTDPAGDGAGHVTQSGHEQPDTDDEQLPRPGHEGSVTGRMGEEPDHGEDSLSGRRASRRPGGGRDGR